MQQKPVRPHPLAPHDVLVTDYLVYWAAAKPETPAITFTDHRMDRGGISRTVTYAELDRWTGAVAEEIARHVRPGGRAAVLCPQGIEYVVAFLAALRAGVVCVPLFPPGLPGHRDRLRAALADCRPDCVLVITGTTGVQAGELPHHATVVSVDLFADRDGSRFVGGGPETSGDLAYLQYTSGSTRAPAGVRITHRNLVANARQIIEAFELPHGETTAVTWLPLFHDMGLLLGGPGAIVCGAHVHLMDPLAFLMKPRRWIEAMAGRPDVISAAPNFAYGYVAKRVDDADLAGADLSGVRALLNGAEPVRPRTVRAFLERCAPAGLRPEVCSPCYGLAEATAFVARSPVSRPPSFRAFDAADRHLGRLRPAGRDVLTVELASCGTTVGQQLEIVDPETRHLLPDGDIGEIWVHGPNVAAGYWGQDAATDATFDGMLASASAGLPARGWLRTGDLGAVVGGELYVTGRRKDLIIVDGRNIYPQDLEAALESVDPVIAARRSAAFAVPSPDGERIVVIAERRRDAHDAAARHDAIAVAARALLSRDMALTLHELVLVEPDTIPRTTSGKIARLRAREAYLDGTLARVVSG